MPGYSKDGGGAGSIDAVSAVVVNYQGERYLEATIGALLALDPAPDEVVVVENGSTDGSLNVLNTRFRNDVTVLRLKENAGAAAARNVGMRAAQNRWVLLVDNDVVLPPEALGRLVEAARERPDAALLQPRSVFADDPERVHYDGGGLHYAGLVSLRNWYRPLAEAEGEGVVPVDCVISLALLADKRAVLEVGGFDEALFVLFEDLDLSYRLRSAGYGLYCVEDVLARHDAGTEGLSFRGGEEYPERRVFLHSRNRWVVLAKCPRVWTVVLSLPALLAYEVAWFAFVVRKGHLGAWWRGKWAFVRSVGAVARKHRAVARRRVVGDRKLLVGGPLTLTPSLARRGVGARVLDGVLRGWWGVVRWLVV